jgi:SlyX protein
VEDKLIDLESRLAFQEDAIESLTRRVLEQQQQMERMVREIGQLTELIQEMASSGSPLGHYPQEGPPPHY